MNNPLAKHLCYLAGPIDRAQDFGVGWRDEISPFLHKLGIGVLNPCDKPSINYRDGSEDSVVVQTINDLKSSGKHEEAHSTMKKIITDDLHLLDISSFIILYIDTDIHMCGSYCEVTYAALEKKPILIFCKQGKNNIPNWLYGLCNPEFFFDSLSEVQDFISSIDDFIKTGPTRLVSKFKILDFRKIFNE